MVRWVVGSISYGGLIELFLVPATAPRLVNKGRDMCYSVCGMMHIKHLLSIEKSSICNGGSGFPLLLSAWPFVRRHITVKNA